jgi:hypothetical protein
MSGMPAGISMLDPQARRAVAASPSYNKPQPTHDPAPAPVGAPPRSTRKWISTVVTGIGGGAIAVQYFRLQEWVDSVTGLVALGGLIFGCGLPGWAIVRWVFNFIEKNRDAGIDEVAKE